MIGMVVEEADRCEDTSTESERHEIINDSYEQLPALTEKQARVLEV
jgi:hypothetical protein